MIAQVNDVIEIKGPTALRYGAEGLVLCLLAADKPVNPSVGDVVLIQRDDGWMIQKRVADTRTVGFFVQGLRREDVPLGSIVSWGVDLAKAVETPVIAPSENVTATT
jgi:hypothetical protein